jgi:hypothetical protein
MITLFASDGEFGFLATNGETGNLVYGEVCTAERLRALCTLLPENSEVDVVVGNGRDKNHLKRCTAGLKVAISSYLEDESLSVSDRILYVSSQETVGKESWVSKMFLLLGLYLTGAICACIFVYIFWWSSSITSHLELNERSRRDVMFVQEHSHIQTRTLSFLSEARFLYGEIEIQMFEVDASNNFTLIFLSEYFGIGMIGMRSAHDLRLVEGSSITTRGELRSLYTLTGVIN